MNSDPHLARRYRMVEEQIRARGVRHERVLEAMVNTPRERFVPAEQQPFAFDDRALPIAGAQTISQPYVVAAMTAYLDPQPHHRVLEIGTGSGYQAAVLAQLARHVYTIERVAHLQDAAREILVSLDLHNISYRIGDGSQGWPEEAPFDAIIVTAGAPEVPPSLLQQLAEPGRIVIPVGTRDDQTLTIVDKWNGRIVEKPVFPCRFVKLLGEEAWPEEQPAR